jgi:hypothetical protein
MSDASTEIRGRYLFLASNAYSGSTLLSFLLGAHPEIGTVSDVSGRRRERVIESFACSCGRLMSECSFWERLLAELGDSGHRFSLADFHLGFDDRRPRWLGALRVRSLGRAGLERMRDALFKLLPGDERRMAELGERNAAFARAVLATTGSAVFVDASKERLRARYLQRYVDPDLRVIHLVRDARGVVESTMRRGKRRISPAEAARRWARTNAAIERSAAALPPNRCLVVRYEDLCADPNSTMRRLFAFCGVETSVDVADLIGRELHLLGNRMRLGAVDEIRLDERWRTMDPDDLRTVIANAGPLQAAMYPRHAGGAEAMS